MSPRLYNAVVVCVLVVWITNFTARLVIPGYQPAPQVDAIFMAIAGGAMALNRRRGRDHDEP